MLVLTPVSAFSSGYAYPYPVVSPVPIQNDYLEAVAQARAEAVRRQRQQELRRRHIEEQRRQASLAAAYQQQVLRERQRRLALARQREEAYVRALLEAQHLERAEQMRLRRAREQQVLTAVASLSAMFELVPEPQVRHRQEKLPPQVHRAPAHAQPSTSQARREPSPVSSARERLQHRLERESDPEGRSAVEGLLSVFPERRQTPTVDRKGKGKAREAPAQPVPGPSSTTQASTSTSATAPAPVSSTPQPATGTTLREALQERLQKEEDPEVKESLNNLFATLYGTSKATTVPEPSNPAAPTSEKVEGTMKEEGPEARPSQDEEKASAPESSAHSDTNLHRTPALPPAVAEKILALYRSRRARRTSLGAIKEIEDALHALESAFVFPAQLDFTPPATPGAEEESRGRGAENGLMYTSNNRTVHAYENALNGLLERLDAVESGGDTEVRGRRKEVVKEVERALRDIERRVEESRERSRERAEASQTEEVEQAASFKVPIVDANSQTVASPSTTEAAAASTADESSEAKDTPVAPIEEPAEVPATPTPTVEESSQSQETPSPAVNPTADVVPTEGSPASQTRSSDEASGSSSTDTPMPEMDPAEAQPSSPHTVADLSYAASTLDIPVSSVLPSPATEEQSAVEELDAAKPQFVPAIEDATAPETSSTSAAAEPHPESSADASEDTTTWKTAEEAPLSSDVAQPSPSTRSDPATDVSSPAGSSAPSESDGDAFLLSSHPLQDPACKPRAEIMSQAGDEPEVVTHAEAEGDNSSEWSEVEA